MLDLKKIREAPDRYRAGLRKRGLHPAAIDAVLDADRRRREVLQQIEALRAEQNRASAEVPRLAGEARLARLAALRALADRLKALEPALEAAEADLDRLLRSLPNQPDDTVPEGLDASANVVVRAWGSPPQFAFPPADHVDLGTRLDIVDFERGAKAAGSRFYYLKGDGVLVEQALVRLAMDLLRAEGFVVMETPMLVRTGVITGAWGGVEFDPQQTYKVETDDLALIGTSEQSLAAYHMDETLEADRLPLRYAGLSWCFRREAGSYGRDVRGLYRVHQFFKVEMFSFAHPARSAEEHEYLVSLEERYVRMLGLPYRVVLLCGGDLGLAMAKTYDVEIWMPGRGGWGETHSCSNAHDFQARRLGIRYREGPRGPAEFVHTLNGTLVATSRMLLALLENYQQADGSVCVPDVLQPYLDGRAVLLPASHAGRP
ncbi:MAG: serine--tRNA ligase [Armatimonadota bacterium]|nr:serine--tRNA ligase [Armatimonadota bacterium]MDR7484698.1 serine--tRNA ligase [Armatimonadota bacterium]MDR7531813.1 serine--tRNA ligase [Armatimonadota bacterium]MDR7534842.1 serine--tRNA ligase [Armatimonadota bacterium]